jgi:N-acetylglucosamine-6-sulfatase
MHPKRWFRPKALKILGTIVIATVTLRATAAAQAQPVPAKAPNIIFVLTDDQRWDTLGCMGHPFVQTPNIDRIAHEGALFRNAFVTTSLCSPSRASFLTGMYAHTHGVIENEVEVKDPDWTKTPSFGMLLQKAGYETGYIGKWHMEPHDRPRPGWDYWLSFKGQGVYNDPLLNENGKQFKAEGYVTELLNDYALKFLKQKRDKPFCLYLSHKAVHDPRTIRPKDADLYSDKTLPIPINYGDTLAGKPRWQRLNVLSKARMRDPIDVTDVPDELPPAGPYKATNKNTFDYLRLLTAVDEGVGQIYKTLEESGQLENTIIIYAGDNGYFFGEHRLGDKRLAYEESLRIPFLMRYPGAIKPGTVIDAMVLNIDLAPTLLDYAKVDGAASMQGVSMRPLLDGKTQGWRTSWLYEYFLDLKPTLPDMVGVRTADWKLIKAPNVKDIDEIYDLKNDPGELHNLAQQPAFEEKRKQLNAELDRLIKDTGYRADIPNPSKKLLKN